MAEIFPMPTVGDVFTDVRGDDRRMRVSYHEDRGVVVVSLWSGLTCKATFRLAAGDVARLAAVLSHVELPPGTASTQDVAVDAMPAPTPEQTGDVSRSALPLILPPQVA